jgi:hypothetical protein
MEPASATALKKALGPLDISRLNLSAVRSAREPAKPREDSRIDPEKAVEAAKDVYSKLKRIDYVTRKREFYKILKGDAAALGRGVTSAEDERISRILSDPGLKGDEGLRVELWKRLNAVCIDIDGRMPPEDKARFKRLVAGARDEAGVVNVDREWMTWCVLKLGDGCVSRVVDGQEYFSFFADRLREKDPKYLEEDWFWAYLFHIMNESAKVRMWAQMSLTKTIMRR